MCSALLKSWKAKSKKAKIFLWFFAVCLLLLILAVPPKILAALSTQVSQIPIAQCRRAESGDPRSPSNPDIPYVISPRRTLLLTDKPRLRWNQVLGVKSYDVSLQKGDSVVWQTKVNTNEIVYPGKPELEPGGEYLLIVKADNGKFSTDEKPNARGFSLLSKQEAQVVKTAIAQLNNQQVPDKVKTLQSAFFYIGSELKSEAIETLEALISGGSKEASVSRKLGDLYWEAGVDVLAETHYLNAHTQAIANKDMVQQAQIAEALGDLYVALDDQKAAINWLTQARNSYKTLGNKQRVEELDTELKQFKSTSDALES
ncbi:tetratricopeptide repeat protein [Scytonema sp. PRP1]|uniref:tetratricopeptide repeat protein n=1 Tax=Scytonema sp. PRP1 TaxID=3120513 RepID=UPI002FD2007B